MLPLPVNSQLHIERRVNIWRNVLPENLRGQSLGKLEEPFVMRANEDIAAFQVDSEVLYEITECSETKISWQFNVHISAKFGVAKEDRDQFVKTQKGTK